MKKILIVDDEQSIITLLTFNLKKEGYEVDAAMDGDTAYKMALQGDYDFIILDLMLPRKNGMDVCRDLRQEKLETPILMLTAKDDELDKIIGLELGADDYMTKPFSPRELAARMNAIFRRIDDEGLLSEKEGSNTDSSSNNKINSSGEEWADQDGQSEKDWEQKKQEEERERTAIKIGDITIYPKNYEVYKGKKAVDLTPKEFELFLYMASQKNRILNRDQLLNAIWNYDYTGGTRIVDVHISHLREKLERDSKNPKYIQTIRGFGYRLTDQGKG